MRPNSYIFIFKVFGFVTYKLICFKNPGKKKKIPKTPGTLKITNISEWVAISCVNWSALSAGRRGNIMAPLSVKWPCRVAQQRQWTINQAAFVLCTRRQWLAMTLWRRAVQTHLFSVACRRRPVCFDCLRSASWRSRSAAARCCFVCSGLLLYGVSLHLRRPAWHADCSLHVKALRFLSFCFCLF